MNEFNMLRKCRINPRLCPEHAGLQQLLGREPSSQLGRVEAAQAARPEQVLGQDGPRVGAGPQAVMSMGFQAQCSLALSKSPATCTPQQRVLRSLLPGGASTPQPGVTRAPKPAM